MKITKQKMNINIATKVGERAAVFAILDAFNDDLCARVSCRVLIWKCSPLIRSNWP